LDFAGLARLNGFEDGNATRNRPARRKRGAGGIVA
jgi:hypothetical protein